MQIEPGKFYKTRDGRVVGPMEDFGSGRGTDRWIQRNHPDEELNTFWNDDGSHWTDRESPTDLVEEVKSE